MSFCPELTLKIDVNSSCINHFFIEKNTFTDGIHFSEWRMHFFYSALLCIVVHPKCFTIMWGSLLNHQQCAALLMRRLPQDNGASALHTPATGGEEREIESIKWMGLLGGHIWQGTVVAILAKTPGLHPYSLREVPWDFLCPQRVRTSV